MHRLIIIFLLVIIPFQTSWAVASAYCAHEAAPASIHPGHHQHGAGAEAEPPADGASLASLDFDCADCHFSNVAIMSSAADGAVAVVSHVRRGAGATLIPINRPERPERPKWRAAA